MSIRSMVRNTPRISAIICTRNRAADLERTLDSLRRQTLPPAEFEVIVVDNGSTDDTQEVVRRYSRRMPNLCCLSQVQSGEAQARTAAACYAQADYLAFIADGAQAAPEWLESLLRTFQQVEPKPAVVGGRVWLDWNGPAPDWLERRYWGLYAFLDHGREAHFLQVEDRLGGANIAFDWEMLMGAGGFPAELVGAGGVPQLCAAPFLLEAAVLGDLPIYYQPQALVWQRVPQRRQSKRWLVAQLLATEGWRSLPEAGMRWQGQRAGLRLRQLGAQIKRAALVLLA